MAKKSLYPLTESMFYVLLCFHRGNMCGSDIAETVRGMTEGRVRLGPGTLYTILSTFQSEKIIEKVSSEGRRITYSITEKGEKLYQDEIDRLRLCLRDAEEV
ncbi:MAG: PadR family transcriptional regulator [Mogibacterium sp.]|nr:PadR family transcriptional regulator [Mogibacterium sp.]